jgi:hypothetical protein
MMGFSGARIEPVIAYRKTAKDAYDQAVRCVDLGPNVCPIIYRIERESYLMEELFLPVGNKDMMSVKNLLTKNVWSRQYRIRPWKHHFIKWMLEQEADFLYKDLESLYPDHTQTANGCETHGDPTWANVMRNSKGELRLIDPLPERAEKPKLREVDMGKMLQSVIGWEEVLIHRKDFDLSALNTTEILLGESDLTCKMSKFWLKVHIWRLRPFANKNNRPDIFQKASEVCHELCL